MSDTTTIILAAMSTIGGIVSAWMSGRAQAHASTAVNAQASAVGAARYVAASLHPPSIPSDLFKNAPISSTPPKTP